MAFYNVRLLRGPQGILTLVWQEVVDNGPANIFAMFYDPATQSWSADRRLTEDQNLAHDVHGYYGSDGQLHLAYLATRVDRTSDTVVIDGQTQTITNVPQDGQTDFRLLDHSLIADLAITDKDITINSQQPQEGDNVTVAVDVHNAGDFAIGNFMVNLYNGDPNTGGVLLGSAVISDSLRAGDHRVVPFNFNLPSGVANIIAVVDPNNSVTEFSKTNNRATLYLNNTAPHASVTASVTSGTAALPVDFDASSSFDNEGDAMSFVWTFADGTASVSGIKVSHIFDQAGVYPVTLTVTDVHGAVGTAVVNITVTASSFQVLTEQSGPNSNQAAAVDAVLFRRDPFPVVGGNGLVNQGSDQNTRVMIFVASLQLAPGETPAAVIVNLVDSNNQSYDIPAEDVRLVPNLDFTQVVFRLPNGLAVGNCSIRVKAHNQITAAGSIRIK
jgi:PKD repeat protein